jgi:uncharacterized membrane protein YozB (DUF420 family)
MLIRQGKRDAHRRCMLSALGVSAAFLTSYLIYHFNVGSVPFQKQGAIRVIYLTILFTHIVLAAAIVPLVLDVSRALSAKFDKHRRIARDVAPVALRLGDRCRNLRDAVSRQKRAETRRTRNGTSFWLCLISEIA